MATYLEDFLEKIRVLPAQVQRNLDLIRQLDETVSFTTIEMKAMQKDYLTAVKEKVKGKPRSGDVDLVALSEDKEALKAIKERQLAALQCAEEKVAVADQAYVLVDKYIQMLDSDLKAYEETLRMQGVFGEVEEPAYEGSAVSGDEKAPGDFGSRAQTALKKSSSDKRKRDRDRERRIGAATAPSVAPSVLGVALTEDPVIDPNEPTFCHCKKVSYGDMVACESEDCPIEWFHFGCVNLKEQPKGKWFCSETCRQKMEGKRARA